MSDTAQEANALALKLIDSGMLAVAIELPVTYFHRGLNGSFYVDWSE